VETKASTTLLHHSTSSRECITQDEKSFGSFLEAFKKIGGMVNEVTAKAIKYDIDRHYIDSNEIEKALIAAHGDSQIIGNVQWRHVLMHVFEKRKDSLYGTIKE